MYKEIENRLGAEIEEIKVLKSGWAGEITSFQLKGNSQRYVIKTYNNSKNGFQDIQQEWKGLNFLYKADYPVPRPIMSSITNETPYIVMEEIQGENLWDCYQNSPKEDKEKILNGFVRRFFELHKLDMSIAGEKLLKDSTVSFIEKEIDEIKKLAEENKLEYFSPIIEWLNNEKINIQENKLCIIHRDYHPWNVIVNAHGKSYVIDLLWGIGDYRFDLAWTYTLMERSGFEDFSHNIFKKYKELKNENIENFDYFKVFSTLRWLINVMISLKTGENLNETRNEEFKSFISPLIQKGIRLIEHITKITI